ncbi:MAG: OmpA family protein [Pseudomonadota bacterium]
MCNWRAWIISGLLTLVILTVVALLVRGSVIEEDLTTRTASMLVEDGVPWATATLDGRDVTLLGTAPSEAARTAALQAAERVSGVFRVDGSQLELLPLADPYELSFSTSGNETSVSGSVPTDIDRAQLIASLESIVGVAPDASGLELARGAPANFSQFANFVARTLQSLSEGNASLSGTVFSVDATAATLESFKIEQERLTNPPLGLTRGTITLRPPLASPYVWGADASGDLGSGVTLTGTVPSEEARSAIIAAAQAFGAVDDQMTLGSGEPEGFATAATALLGQMAQLIAAEASIEDAALTLQGEAPDNDAFVQANAFLGVLPDGFDSLSGRIAPPLVDPYRIALVHDGVAFTLSGHLPDETSRAVVLDRIEALNDEAIDTATIARGAPSNVDIGGLFAKTVGILADLVEGSGTLEGDVFTIEGTTRDRAAFAGVEDQLDALRSEIGDALTVVSLVKAPPESPFALSAIFDDAGIALSGFGPDEATAETLSTDIDALFSAYERRTSRLIVADGAPSGFLAAAQAGLRGLVGLKNGQLTLEDQTLSLSGLAPSVAERDSIESELGASLPQGFALTTDLEVVAAPAIDAPALQVSSAVCQANLDVLLASDVILFETGQAIIDALSFDLLDQLAQTLRTCSDASVEVAGHTDAQGSDALNQQLSEARASAIVDYLVSAGITTDRLTAIGFGENEPIADNATSRGRALNRRIEFTVERVAE